MHNTHLITTVSSIYDHNSDTVAHNKADSVFRQKKVPPHGCKTL